MKEIQSEKAVPPEGVSVVLPCLNEAESISRVIADALGALQAMGLPHEVIVVDNGSTDASAALAAEAGARVVHESRRGYGAAIRRGFAEARYSVLVMADADVTYDLAKVADLVQPVLDGEVDFVLGNRLKGMKPDAMPFLHRVIGNPLLTKLVQYMFRRGDIEDGQSGYRAIRRSVYESLDCITTGMEFASEMIVKAIHANVRLKYVPIEYHPRIGDSKLRTFRDGWRHLRFLMLHSPSMIFVLPGLVVWVLSLLAAFPMAFGQMSLFGHGLDIHFMLIIGLFNIISMQLITIGMLAKAYAHLSGFRHDRLVEWFYQKLSFELGALVGLGLFLLGGGIALGVVIFWSLDGFGALNLARLLFFGILCIINGTQLGASAYLFSVMALPRRLDHIDKGAESTAIFEVQ